MGTMNNTTTETNVLPAWLRGWERFWFTPADPTVLGSIRILAGLITLYTIAVFSFGLQDLYGENGWYDLQLRMGIVRDRPVLVPPLSGAYNLPAPPRNAQEERYAE